VLKPTVLPPDKPVEMSLGTIADAPAVEPVRAQPTEPATVQPFSETVYFAFDSYELRLSTKTALEEIGKRLTSTQGNVYLVGGCSPEGTELYNKKLGFFRAKAAQDFLVAIGVEKSRITCTSVGKLNLVTTDEKEYWKNRRCEIGLKEK
jgi:outer membrane protein OmpA-like peptidoglycan-associated protein